MGNYTKYFKYSTAGSKARSDPFSLDDCAILPADASRQGESSIDDTDRCHGHQYHHNHNKKTGEEEEEQNGEERHRDRKRKVVNTSTTGDTARSSQLHSRQQHASAAGQKGNNIPPACCTRSAAAEKEGGSTRPRKIARTILLKEQHEESSAPELEVTALPAPAPVEKPKRKRHSRVSSKNPALPKERLLGERSKHKRDPEVKLRGFCKMCCFLQKKAKLGGAQNVKNPRRPWRKCKECDVFLCKEHFDVYHTTGAEETPWSCMVI